MQKKLNQLRCVLFDLDGTLADTAPDLAAAINLQRQQRSMPVLPLPALRPFVSKGAQGMVGKAFGLRPGDADYEALRIEFLKNYEEALCVHTRLFGGVTQLLYELGLRGYQWGVVTNKAQRYSEPLLAQLQSQLQSEPAVIVSGDSTAHAKPHPLPLLHAANLLGLSPEQCIYVGDDLRDIQAGRAAQMMTVAAAYGYGADEGVHDWQADLIISEPIALLDFL